MRDGEYALLSVVGEVVLEDEETEHFADIGTSAGDTESNPETPDQSGDQSVARISHQSCIHRLGFEKWKRTSRLRAQTAISTKSAYDMHVRAEEQGTNERRETDQNEENDGYDPGPFEIGDRFPMRCERRHDLVPEYTQQNDQDEDHNQSCPPSYTNTRTKTIQLTASRCILGEAKQTRY